jgi:hypothetical protein
MFDTVMKKSKLEQEKEMSKKRPYSSITGGPQEAND